MSFFAAAARFFLPKAKKPRTQLLSPKRDLTAHPAFAGMPEYLVQVLQDPTRLRNPPYQEGYYGLISGEFCMRNFQEALLNKLVSQSGLSPEEYSSYLEPILISYAELVHLLPASENHHHNTPGGLLRHGLEVACFMLNWMVTTKFDHDLTPGQASKRLRRWYTAGIIAALLHDAGKPLTDVRVTSFCGTKTWIRGKKTIHQWCVEHDMPYYFLSWVKERNGKHVSQAPVLLGSLVGQELYEWINDGGSDIWQALVDAVSDQPGILTAAVKESDSLSVQVDRKRGPSIENNSNTGIPLASLCVDAMRYLLDEGIWKFNEHGSRLWKTTQGVFMVWSTGSEDIIHRVVKDNVPGFPRSESTLLAAMSQHELFEKAPNDTFIWFVSPHLLHKNGKGPSIRCVKLKNPAGVFPILPDVLEPVSVTIGRDADAVEYLSPADLKAHKDQEQAQKRKEKSGQGDLLDTLAVPASKAEERADREQEAKRRGVSRTEPAATQTLAEVDDDAQVQESPEIPAGKDSPDLSDEDASTASGDASAKQEPEITEAQADDESDLLPENGLDDNTIERLLVELNSLPADAEPVTAPKPKAEPVLKVTTQQVAAALEVASGDEDGEESAAPVGKISFEELMGIAPDGNPKGKKKRKKPAPSESSAPTEAEEKKPAPVEPEQHTAPVVVATEVIYPDRFAARAQDWMTAYLQVNPGLANRLLAEFDTNLQVREVRNRVFIPLNGLLSEKDMPALLEAGWVWRDYTSTADEMTRSLRGVTGTLASKKLSLIYCALTEPDWHPKCPEKIPRQHRGKVMAIGNELQMNAKQEAARGNDIFSFPFWSLEKFMASNQLTLEQTEYALLYALEAVKVGREKKYLFRVPVEADFNE